jgi:hypothetical protein
VLVVEAMTNLFFSFSIFRDCPKVRRHNQELSYTVAVMPDLRADNGDEILYYYALIHLAAGDQDIHPDCCFALCPPISDRTPDGFFPP